MPHQDTRSNMPPAPTQQRRHDDLVGRIVPPLLLGVLVYLILKMTVFDINVVPSASMEPTIMTGDRVMSSRLERDDVEAGDIVTFPDPDHPNVTLVKRVVATEGEVVDLVGGRLVVNGEERRFDGERGYSSEMASDRGRDVTFPLELGEGELFCMGDNREHSADSRVFGAIAEDSVIAVVKMVYWPPERVGPIDGGDD